MNDFVPYARQVVDEDDIAAVVEVLRGDWLTTGPTVAAFEEAFAQHVAADHAVAVASGTAALHLLMLAAGIGPGDEVIVPSLTFVASANAVRYVGADPVFADVRDDTLTLDVESVRSLVGPRTRAVLSVDYAGVPCDVAELRSLARTHGLRLFSDSCHALGATYRGRPVGSLVEASTFSFHPVKHLTTGEGGMVVTDDAELARTVRRLRNHGITTDSRQREAEGTWEYDLVDLGFNYRLPDVACALGLSQLAKLDGFVARRRELADRYGRLLGHLEELRPLEVPDDRTASWHLYPVRLEGPGRAARRQQVFAFLREHGVGVNVHYRPVHLNSYYRSLGHAPGLTPVAEEAYDGLLSLPMWPGLTDAAQDRVVELLTEALRRA